MLAGARTRVAIAAEYIQKGQPDLALQQLQRALELNPKSAEAHNVMGVLLEKDDNFVEAEQSYRKALSLKADYPQNGVWVWACDGVGVIERCS